MKKLKVLFIVVVALVAILIAVPVGFVMFFDPNDHKDFIVAQVEKRTGRDFALEGNIELSWYPWLGLTVEDVRLGNAEGFGDAPFFESELLQARVKLLPLLRKQIEMDTIRVHGTHVNLAVNAEGHTNWADLAGEAEPEPREPLQLGALAIGGVDIEDARLSYVDARTDTRYTISEINVQTGELVIGEPIELTASLNADSSRPALRGSLDLKGTIAYDLGGQRFTLKPLTLQSTFAGPNVPGGRGELRLGAAVDVNLDEETATVSELDFDTLGTSVKGSLAATRIKSETPAVQADLAVKGADVARLLKVLEIEPLASELAKLPDRGFELATRLEADMREGDVHVPELKASVLGADIDGRLKASDVQSDEPAVKGMLSARGPDLPALIRLAGQFQGGEEKTLAELGRKLAGAPERAFEVATDFDVDLAYGSVKIPELRVRALGIAVDGNLQASDIQKKSGKMEGRLTVAGKRLGPILKAVEQPRLAEVVQALDVRAGITGSMSDLALAPLQIDATLAGKDIPNSPVKLALNADARANLDKQTLTLSEVNLRGLGLDVKADLQASRIMDAPSFTGRLDVTPFNLRALMRQLNQEVPETADPEVLTRVGMSTHLEGSQDRVKLSKLAMTLDETSIKGDLSVDGFEQPDIAFGFGIDKLNADRYLPPKAKGEARAPATPEAAAAKATELPLEMLRELRIKGDLVIGELVLSGARMSDIKLSLNARDGKIRLNPATANLYQGSYTGDIQLDATGKLAKLALESTLVNVAAGPLLRDMTGKAQLTGTGNLNADLNAQGRNTDALKRTLTGVATFTFRDGTYRGINVGHVLRQANAIIKGKSPGGEPKQQTTDFAELSGTLNFKNGLISNDDLSMKSPAMRVSGKGTASLVNERVNYTVKAALAKTVEGQGGQGLDAVGGVEIPIRCKGTLEQPGCKPDFGGLATAAVKEKAKEQVDKAIGDKLKDALPGDAGEKLKDLLKF